MKVKIGDTIKVRVCAAYGNLYGTRKVKKVCKGLHGNRFVEVRAFGCSDFTVLYDEIVEVNGKKIRR